MPAGIFGITDDTVNLVVNLLILFLVVVWLALIAWTYFDAKRRIEDPVLVAFAAAASIFPYAGTLVYSILRPPELLDERHERELEIRAAELRVRQLEEQSCPNCESPIERSFLRCPSCRARIKSPCPSCAEPVDPRWSVCPYCETALRRAAAPTRRPAEAAPGRRPEQPKRQAQRQPARQAPDQPARQAPDQPARQAPDQPARQAPASSADGGPREATPQRQPRTKERKQRSSRSSGRRSSPKQRS